MPESLSKIPGGMRHHFGGEARLRRGVEAGALAVFDGRGYEEIATPAVDYYALFERGMGSEEAARAFRFADTDGRERGPGRVAAAVLWGPFPHHTPLSHLPLTF